MVLGVLVWFPPPSLSTSSFEPSEQCDGDDLSFFFFFGFSFSFFSFFCLVFGEPPGVPPPGVPPPGPPPPPGAAPLGSDRNISLLLPASRMCSYLVHGGSSSRRSGSGDGE